MLIDRKAMTHGLMKKAVAKPKRGCGIDTYLEYYDVGDIGRQGDDSTVVAEYNYTRIPLFPVAEYDSDFSTGEIRPSLPTYGNAVNHSMNWISCTHGHFPVYGTVNAVGDVTGDGSADYYVYAEGRRYQISEVGVEEIFAGIGGSAGDVNGDGLLDPISSSSDRTIVHVGRPVGSSSLTLSNSFLTPIGDFNADGYLDFFSSRGPYEDSYGGIILLGSRAGFTLLGGGTYNTIAKSGAAPLRAVGEVPGGLIYPPDARAWIGFADGNGPSKQTVWLYRNLEWIYNIPTGLKPAAVHWEIATDRAAYTSATLEFKYLDREISGLNEDNLVLLESSTGVTGPWYINPSASFEKYRNTVHFQTANLGDYLIAEYLPPNVTAHTFNRDTESWTFAAPLRPDLAAGAWVDGYGALEIGIGPGANSFAFYEGPLAPVVNQSQPALYRLRYRAFTDQSNRFDNPLIRFRASLANYEQTQELVAPPVDNVDHRDEFSPSLEGTDYEQFFLAPPNTSAMRMDFDAIGTDAAYHGYARVSLDAARLEPFTADGPTTTVLNFDFRNSQTNGFTLAAPHPTLTPAGFDASVTAEGLSLRASATDAAPRLAFQFFGKTEGALRFEGDHLYRADFTIGSHATPANAHALPGFRLRVNSESFQFATLLHVEPRNAIQPLPTEGAPQTYSLYFKAPAAIDGEAAIFSFDYLTTPDAQADSTQAIVLQTLAVAEY
ncbi:hypothetical protein BH09SUM1_BH09SUM1_34190 [soil metagenome]